MNSVLPIQQKLTNKAREAYVALNEASKYSETISSLFEQRGQVVDQRIETERFGMEMTQKMDNQRTVSAVQHFTMFFADPVFRLNSVDYVGFLIEFISKNLENCFPEVKDGMQPIRWNKEQYGAILFARDIMPSSAAILCSVFLDKGKDNFNPEPYREIFEPLVKARDALNEIRDALVNCDYDDQNLQYQLDIQKKQQEVNCDIKDVNERMETSSKYSTRIAIIAVLISLFALLLSSFFSCESIKTMEQQAIKTEVQIERIIASLETGV